MSETRTQRSERIATTLLAEIRRRDEWYGLDNWSPDEVVEFVLDRLEVPQQDDPNLGSAAHGDTR